MKKLTYLISDIDHALSFEWIAANLDKQFELSFILINNKPSQLALHLQNMNCSCKEYLYQSRFGLVLIWFKLFFNFIKNRPDILHCHLYYADLLGLTVSWLLRIKMRVYTRHHSDIHHVDFPGSVKIDKALNWLATDIIVMSSPLKELLITKEAVSPEKLRFIPHGFDLEYFKNVSPDLIQTLKDKYKIEESTYPVIGVIARYVNWKGIQFIIAAFKQLLEIYPNARLILANAKGDYKEVIQGMLKGLKSGSYTEIEFEPDLAALYKIFDVYVHTPVRLYAESFGQTYVEALAAGIPSVFTISGIAKDFIENEKNALVVPYEDSSSICEALIRMIKEKKLKNHCTEKGKRDTEQFNLKLLMSRMESLYL